MSVAIKRAKKSETLQTEIDLWRVKYQKEREKIWALNLSKRGLERQLLSSQIETNELKNIVQEMVKESSDRKDEKENTKGLSR